MSQKQEEKKELSPLEKKLLQLRLDTRALAAIGKPERMEKYRAVLREKLPDILDKVIKRAGEDGDFCAGYVEEYVDLDFKSDVGEVSVILADMLKAEGLSAVKPGYGGFTLNLPDKKEENEAPIKEALF